VKHTLEVDDVRFEVDPEVGARITSFRLGAFDVLSGPDVDERNFGSTFWTSPQRDWGWPPPAEVDCAPYDVSVEGGVLTLTSGGHGPLGVRVTKRFSVDRASRSIALEYRIHNVTSTPKTYAPWEVSRVRARGLTFFPPGAWVDGPLPLHRCRRALWFDHDASGHTEDGRKSAADGAGGFVAHAVDGHLFLKTFVDVPPYRLAPGQGEIEIYANRRYVELEVQGPYARIEAGQSTCWSIRWYLRKLPAGLVVAPRSDALLEFVSAVARRRERVAQAVF
jgi:hypothetical protein